MFVGLACGYLFVPGGPLHSDQGFVRRDAFVRVHTGSCGSARHAAGLSVEKFGSLVVAHVIAHRMTGVYQIDRSNRVYDGGRGQNLGSTEIGCAYLITTANGLPVDCSRSRCPASCRASCSNVIGDASRCAGRGRRQIDNLAVHSVTDSSSGCRDEVPEPRLGK